MARDTSTQLIEFGLLNAVIRVCWSVNVSLLMYLHGHGPLTMTFHPPMNGYPKAQNHKPQNRNGHSYIELLSDRCADHDPRQKLPKRFKDPDNRF